MSQIDMSAIAVVLTLARCPSFVQNGAQRVETRGARMGRESRCTKLRKEAHWNLSPSLLFAPSTAGTLISFRGAVKYFNASLYLLLAVGLTNTERLTDRVQEVGPARPLKLV